MRSLAAIAGINNSIRDRNDVARQRRERESSERAAAELRERERRERLLSGDGLHWLDRRKERISQQLHPCQQNERLWASLAATHRMLQRELTSYTLLSFGDAQHRSEYVLHPDRRSRMLDSIQECGFVVDDDGRRREVLE